MTVRVPAMESDRVAAGLRIAVLIPCRNEALTVANVVASFRRELPDADIWVCDNRSIDSTAAVAGQAGARVVTEERPGKGHAVRRLFTVADADLYVLVDGDDTYDARSVQAMIECLVADSLDMVVARRVTSPTGERAAYRRGHRSGNRAFAHAVSRLFGYPLQDIFSGYRVLSRGFVRSFPALSRGFEIETELTVHALDLDLPIREIDAPYGARPAGSESKLSTIRDGARIAALLVYLYEQVHPARFFGLVGAVFGAASVIVGTPVVVHFLQTGLVPRLPTAVLASALMLLAALAAVCGIVLDSVGRGRKETKRLAHLAAGRW